MASQNASAPAIDDQGQLAFDRVVNGLKAFGLRRRNAIAFVQDTTNGNDANILDQLIHQDLYRSTDEATGKVQRTLRNADPPLEPRLHVRVELEEHVDIIELNRVRFNALCVAWDKLLELVPVTSAVFIKIELFVQNKQIEGLEGIDQSVLTKLIATTVVALFMGSQTAAAAILDDKSIAATSPLLLYLLGAQWYQLLFQKTSNAARTALSLTESILPYIVNNAALMYVIANPEFYTTSAYVATNLASRLILTNTRLFTEPAIRLLQAYAASTIKAQVSRGGTAIERTHAELMDKNELYREALTLFDNVTDLHPGGSRGLVRNISNMGDVGANLVQKIGSTRPGEGSKVVQKLTALKIANLTAKEANLCVAIFAGVGTTALAFVAGSPYVEGLVTSVAVDMIIRAYWDMKVDQIKHEEAERRTATRIASAGFVTVPLNILTKAFGDAWLQHPWGLWTFIVVTTVLSQLFGYSIGPYIRKVAVPGSNLALICLKYAWVALKALIHGVIIAVKATNQFMIEMYARNHRIREDELRAAITAALQDQDLHGEGMDAVFRRHTSFEMDGGVDDVEVGSFELEQARDEFATVIVDQRLAIEAPDIVQDPSIFDLTTRDEADAEVVSVVEQIRAQLPGSYPA